MTLLRTIALAATLLSLAASACGQASPKTECRVDGELDSKERADIEATALDFAKLLGNGDVDGVLTSMASQVGAAPQRSAVAQLAAKAKMNGSFSKASVEHVYQPEAVGGGIVPVMCGGQVTVSAIPAFKQAYVLISAPFLFAPKDKIALSLWLIQQQGQWKALSYDLGAEALAGLGADEMLQLARRERDAGQSFNAAVLYVAVGGMTHRGSALHLAIQKTLEEDLRTFKRPPELEGSPPFKWRLGGKDYVLDDVTVDGGPTGQLGLGFKLHPAFWSGDEAAEV